MSAQTLHAVPVDLGGGYSVEFSFTGGRLDCVWSPDMPNAADGPALLPRYRAARNAFLEAVAQVLSCRVAVVEPGDAG